VKPQSRIVLLVFTLFMLGSVAALAQTVVGTVRIQNPHSIFVEVYSQTYDTYGRQNWVFITAIPPNNYVDIPGVPNGALLGLQTQNASRVWSPINVYYPNPYSPFVIYLVPQ